MVTVIMIEFVKALFGRRRTRGDVEQVGGTGPIPVSVIVITLNEAESIRQCLGSVKEFCEVIVVDSGSVDATCSISESMGASVVHFDWNHSLPKKKQWSLDNANAAHDWVLLLDADEVVSPELVSEVRYLVDSRRIDEHDAYDAKFRYVFAGVPLRYGHVVKKRVLLNKSRCAFPEVDDTSLPGSFEVEGHFQPQARRSVGELTNRIIHDDRDSISSWFERHNRYSDWEAALRGETEIARQINRSKSDRGRKFASIPFKPVLFFLYSFVLNAGFRDGRAGFDYAVALSFYYWQIALKTRLNRDGHER